MAIPVPYAWHAALVRECACPQTGAVREWAGVWDCMILIHASSHTKPPRWPSPPGETAATPKLCAPGTLKLVQVFPREISPTGKLLPSSSDEDSADAAEYRFGTSIVPFYEHNPAALDPRKEHRYVDSLGEWRRNPPGARRSAQAEYRLQVWSTVFRCGLRCVKDRHWQRCGASHSHENERDCCPSLLDSLHFVW